MNLVDRMRRLREYSRLLRGIHAAARRPYYAMLGILYPRGIKIDLAGLRPVKLHTGLLGIRPEIYEPEFSSVIDKYARTGMTVLDVGAHVGLHTLRLCQRIGQCGRVIAVEPSPANAALLRKHLAWNGYENVTVVEAAVAERRGEAEFAFRRDPIDPGGFANSFAYDVGGGKARIRVTTLDEICNGLAPDLIKIDEGAEMLAIQGARETLGRCSPVLLIAFHPKAMAALGASPAELVRFLSALGYGARHLDGRIALEPGFEEIVFEKTRNPLPPQSPVMP
jgi:FkbM family methyltransferase